MTFWTFAELAVIGLAFGAAGAALLLGAIEVGARIRDWWDTRKRRRRSGK